MTLARLEDETDHEFSHYENLAKKHPWMGLYWFLVLVLWQEFHPFAGFIAKLLLISVAFEAKLYFSLSVMIIGVVISIYYYFGWIREITFHPKPTFLMMNEKKSPEIWEQCGYGLFKPCMIALAIISLVLGIWQGPFGDAF